MKLSADSTPAAVDRDRNDTKANIFLDEQWTYSKLWCN